MLNHFLSLSGRRSLFVTLIPFLFFFCEKKNEKSEIYFIIQHSMPISSEILNIPPLPPKSFYGNFNFILLDNSTIYVHSQKNDGKCFTGICESKPKRVFLIPDSLKVIKIDSLPQFLRTIVNKSIEKDRYFFATISAPTDTIKNPGFRIINDYFKSQKKMSWIIRSCTEEEKFVALAKFEKETYYPDSIKWKVGFCDK